MPTSGGNADNIPNQPAEHRAENVFGGQTNAPFSLTGGLGVSWPGFLVPELGASVASYKAELFKQFGIVGSSFSLSRFGCRLLPDEPAENATSIIWGCVGGGKKGKKMAGEIGSLVGAAGIQAAAASLGVDPIVASLASNLGARAGASAAKAVRTKVARPKKITGSGDYSMENGQTYVKNSLFGGGSSFGDSVTKSLSGVRVKHRDCMGDITASGTEWSVSSYEIDPTSKKLLPFTAISGMNYNKYRVHGIAFEYVPLLSTYSSTQSMGMLGILASTNPHQAPFNNMTSFLNSYGAISAVPYKNIIYGMECAEGTRPTDILFTKDPYTAQQAVVEGETITEGVNANWYTLGMLQVAQSTPSYEPGIVLGQLFCTLDIEWLEPRVSPSGYGMYLEETAATTYCSDQGSTTLFNPGLTSDEFEGSVVSRAAFGSLSDVYTENYAVSSTGGYSLSFDIVFPSVNTADLVCVILTATAEGGVPFVSNVNTNFAGELVMGVVPNNGASLTRLVASQNSSGIVFSFGNGTGPEMCSPVVPCDGIDNTVTMMFYFVVTTDLTVAPRCTVYFPVMTIGASSEPNYIRVINSFVISNGVLSPSGGLASGSRGREVCLSKVTRPKPAFAVPSKEPVASSEFCVVEPLKVVKPTRKY